MPPGNCSSAGFVAGTGAPWLGAADGPADTALTFRFFLAGLATGLAVVTTTAGSSTTSGGRLGRRRTGRENSTCRRRGNAYAN